MSLADRVREATPTEIARPKCSIALTVQSLTQEDADALYDAVFRRLDLTASEIEAMLLAEGIENVSQHTISRHRRNQCATCRKAGHGTL